MDYRTLGRTGVKVSPLCLGAMMFGAFGNTDHDDSIRIIHRAIDAGINFIDTADVYSFGESEEIVGKALAQVKRHQIVLATKVHGTMGKDPNAQGNSRRWIMTECDRSLTRLGTDYIDLYQIHRPSPDTDIDETLGALTDLVRAGKIRYFGSSTFPAHEIVEAQWVAERRGRERFVTEQPPYSILVRSIEKDVLPMCEKYGMGVLSWSPLAGGWLSGAFGPGKENTSRRAAALPHHFDMELPGNQAKLEAVTKLTEVADDAGLPSDSAGARLRARPPGGDVAHHWAAHHGAPGVAATGARAAAELRRARPDRRHRRAGHRPERAGRRLGSGRHRRRLVAPAGALGAARVDQSVLTRGGGWSRSRRGTPARFASTRRSTSSWWAWGWPARRPPWRRARPERRCWPSSAARVRVGRRPSPAGSSTWEAGRPSRARAASPTHRRTWRRSSGPPSGPARTTTASMPTARARRSTSTGWSPSACRSAPRSATSRTASRPMTRGCSSAAVRTATRSTSWRSRYRAATSRSTSTRPAASSWNASVPPCRASAARVVADARAEALVVDGGEVVGVEVRTDDGSRAVRARGGVILATGGFIHNEAMVAEHCPLAHVPDAAWRIGTPADDGRGIRMGAGAGAVTTRLDAFECALPLGPPHRLARGILVNRGGERFVNEDTYTGRIGLQALRDHEGVVYMITDDVIHEPNLLGLRIRYAAATPEELAADIEVPADALARTVREYNEAAAHGEDPAFHKRAPYLQPIGVPPASGIGAIDLRVDHGAIYATFTLGGLVTDPEGAALDGAGRRVPGLYAVGRTAASLAAHDYASGISLGDGSFFGRRAGRHAAHRARAERSSPQ